MKPSTHAISSSLRWALFTGSCAFTALGSACQDDPDLEAPSTTTSDLPGTQDSFGSNVEDSIGGTQGGKLPGAGDADNTQSDEGPQGGGDSNGPSEGQGSGGANGVPTLNPKCAKNLKVNHPERGMGVEYNADCSVAYVLLPTTAPSKVGGFLPTMNLGFCSSMETLAELPQPGPDSEGVNAKLLENAAARVDTAAKELKAKELETTQTKAKLEKLTASLKPEQEKRDSLRENEDAARATLNECKDNAKSAEECAAETDAFNEAKIAFREQRDLVRKLEGEIRRSENKIDRLQSEVEELEREYAKQKKSLAELEESLEKQGIPQDLLKKYIVMEGAVGNMYFTLGWDKLIQAYRDENPDYEGRFVPIPLEHVSLHAAAKLGTTARFPATYPVPVPRINWGSSPTIRPLAPHDVANERFALGSHATPQAAVESERPVGVNVSLSLVGACTAYDSDTDELTAEKLNQTVSWSMVYSYKVETPLRQYVLKYSMGRWLQAIKAQEEPFTSESLQKSIANAGASDWMSMDFRANDAQFQYTPEEQAAITTDVAHILVNNSLNQIAMRKGTTYPSANAGTPTQQALHRFARSQRETCGAFSFCYISDYMGELYADVREDKAKLDKFEKINSEWQTAKVEGKKTLLHYGSIQLVPGEASVFQ